MKFEDENFEKEFINWLSRKIEQELVESLSKYKKIENKLKELKVK